MTSEWIATVVSSAVTGVVGVAGIGAALISSRSERSAQIKRIQVSIDAEDKRARLNEKRRIYALYLASLDKSIEATGKLATYGAAVSKEERRAMVFQQGEALTAMVSLSYELLLIAPESVGRLADEACAILSVEAATIEDGRESDIDDEFVEAREKLYRAMREDLGEPPHSPFHLDGSSAP